MENTSSFLQPFVKGAGFVALQKNSEKPVNSGKLPMKKLCKVKNASERLSYCAKFSIDAEFICKSCGRVSSKKKTLCKPEKIKAVLKAKATKQKSA